MQEICFFNVIKEIEKSIEAIEKKHELDPQQTIFILANIIKAKAVEI